MARPTLFENHRYLGDRRTQEVHDLDQLVDDCEIDELVASAAFATFGPDVLAEARNRGYRAHSCAHGD